MNSNLCVLCGENGGSKPQRAQSPQRDCPEPKVILKGGIVVATQASVILSGDLVVSVIAPRNVSGRFVAPTMAAGIGARPRRFHIRENLSHSWFQAPGTSALANEIR